MKPQEPGETSLGAIEVEGRAERRMIGPHRDQLRELRAGLQLRSIEARLARWAGQLNQLNERGDDENLRVSIEKLKRRKEKLKLFRNTARDARRVAPLAPPSLPRRDIQVRALGPIGALAPGPVGHGAKPGLGYAQDPDQLIQWLKHHPAPNGSTTPMLVGTGSTYDTTAFEDGEYSWESTDSGCRLIAEGLAGEADSRWFWYTVQAWLRDRAAVFYADDPDAIGFRDGLNITLPSSTCDVIVNLQWRINCNLKVLDFADEHNAIRVVANIQYCNPQGQISESSIYNERTSHISLLPEWHVGMPGFPTSFSTGWFDISVTFPVKEGVEPRLYINNCLELCAQDGVLEIEANWISSPIAYTIVRDIPASSSTYVVEVKTGNVDKADTRARVWLQLIGTKGQTEEIELDNTGVVDRRRNTLDRYGFTRPSVGELRQVRIWHDNTGQGPGWFLEYVRVFDHTNDMAWFCACNRWLARTEDDGHTERLLEAQLESP